MAFAFSMRGTRAQRATTAARADGTRAEWCSFDSKSYCLPTASVLPMGEWRLRHVAIFLAALGQMAIAVRYSTNTPSLFMVA
jgi:hypothetical protein